MTYDELLSFFQSCCKMILTGTLSNVEKYIRKNYPTGGNPDWKVTDDIVFLFLHEKNDDYGRYPDIVKKVENGTINEYVVRTRVWELQLTAYGPHAYDISNQLRNGFRTELMTRTMTGSSIFLIPDYPNCIAAYEERASQWWKRWDLVLQFNENYTSPAEDVGHIDTASIRVVAQRRTK